VQEPAPGPPARALQIDDSNLAVGGQQNRFPAPQTFCGLEARLQAFEPRLEQSRNDRSHQKVTSAVGKILRTPFDRTSGTVRFDLKRSGIVRCRNAGDVRVAIILGRIVDLVKALDNLLAIDCLDGAQLPYSCAGQLDAGDQRVPTTGGLSDTAELSDQLPDPIGSAVEIERSVTLCSSVFGVAKYGKFLLPGLLARSSRRATVRDRD
jgi:hypothetical protein